MHEGPSLDPCPKTTQREEATLDQRRLTTSASLRSEEGIASNKCIKHSDQLKKKQSPNKQITVKLAFFRLFDSMNSNKDGLSTGRTFNVPSSGNTKSFVDCFCNS
jgi:hypothetical protein